jgi:hypothetical protein
MMSATPRLKGVDTKLLTDTNKKRPPKPTMSEILGDDLPDSLK